jgi:hypothetical protein
MEIGTIISEGELKLMLLKHWTLNESINNSNYLIAKLKLTKYPAQNKYKELRLCSNLSLWMHQLGVISKRILIPRLSNMVLQIF